MQQLCLFTEKNKIELNRWNIYFMTNKNKENIYIAILQISSWKFIARYTLEDKKIDTFEIIDYIWYIYLSISMIKNIKTLIWTILKKF